jgi:hypothetical protein
VAINLPIFVDENTPQPFIDPSIPWERNIYKEDPGKRPRPYYVGSRHLTVPRFRGKEWRCSCGSYIHGCDGFWDGLFLFADYIPGMQR